MAVMKMDRVLLLAVCLFTILPSVSGFSETDCPAVSSAQNVYFRSATDTCYYLWPGQKTYSDAKSECEQNGLHLVQLEDAAEQTWLHQRISNQHWLGLQKSAAGVWSWVTTGETVPSTGLPWVAGTITGNRAFKQTATQWAPTTGTTSYSVVCEVSLGTNSSTTTPSIPTVQTSGPTAATTTTAPATTTATATTTTTTTSSTTTTVGETTQPPVCSGFKRMYFRKVDSGYLMNYLTFQGVYSTPECGIKCARQPICRGIHFVLHAGKCTLQMPSLFSMTCPSGTQCYQLFFADGPQSGVA